MKIKVFQTFAQPLKYPLQFRIYLGLKCLQCLDIGQIFKDIHKNASFYVKMAFKRSMTIIIL